MENTPSTNAAGPTMVAFYSHSAARCSPFPSRDSALEPLPVACITNFSSWKTPRQSVRLRRCTVEHDVRRRRTATSRVPLRFSEKLSDLIDTSAPGSPAMGFRRYRDPRPRFPDISEVSRPIPSLVMSMVTVRNHPVS